ncbi:SET domain-containing protein, partial [Aureobasidium namibiae CBS 147.97]
TSGNGLFATKDIPAGSTILLKPRPLIGELDLPRLEESCHNCFLWSHKAVRVCAGEIIGIKACTGCKKVRYCSKACQKQAWTRYHKQECKLLRDPNLPPIPSSVRAALQLAFLMDSSAMSEEDKAGVLRLGAHDATTIQTPFEVMNYEVTTTAASDLYLTIFVFTRTVLSKKQILRNSLTLTSPVLDPMGIALDPTVCSANHSCEPNATVLFDQPYLMMRSLSPIRKGEEVFISYIDNTDPYYRRQTQLKQRYCFECQCPKCQYGTNGREDDWAQPLEKLAPKCKAEKDLSILQSWIYHDYEPVRNQKDDTLATEALEHVMRSCKQTEMWPITRQPYANIRVDITSRMLSQNRLGLALFQMAKTYFLINPILYPQDFHPVRVVHTWNLA